MGATGFPHNVLGFLISYFFIHTSQNKKTCKLMQKIITKKKSNKLNPMSFFGITTKYEWDTPYRHIQSWGRINLFVPDSN